MSKRISIKVGQVQATAVLNDTATARAIWDALPLKAKASTWGDEIYFPVLVVMEEEGAQELVSMGDIAYWPPGRAFCIFFGPTPVSEGDEIRPASPVKVVGSIEGDPTVFRSTPAGVEVTLERFSV
ncbi:MAG: cyclophilin-like fold protein [Dehalococcoidia bacterium]